MRSRSLVSLLAVPALAVPVLALAACSGSVTVSAGSSSGGSANSAASTVTATAAASPTAAAASPTYSGKAHVTIVSAKVVNGSTVLVHIRGRIPLSTGPDGPMLEESSTGQVMVSMVWNDGQYVRTNDGDWTGTSCLGDDTLFDIDANFEIETDPNTPPQGMPVTASICGGTVTAEKLVPAA